MTRPIKKGLDYFPVDILFDDSIELLQAECGIQAIGILIKIWQKIYQNGYYIKWDEDTKLLFSKHNVISVNDIEKFIASCFKRKIFDEILYKKYNILTSTGIQKRFLKISKECKRTTISVISEYKLVNGEYNSIITEEIRLISESNTQSKGKKSKEKDSIEKNMLPSEEIDVFGSQHNIKLTQTEVNLLKMDYPDEYLEAIEYLSLYIAEKGDKSKSGTHNLTIRRWVINAIKQRHEKMPNIKPVKKSIAQGFWEVANELR